MLEISTSLNVNQLDQVRSLMQSLVDWLQQHYSADTRLIDEYFDEKAFTEELSSLPGKYAQPSGQLLLATQQGEPAGCVGLCQLDEHTCEMKRLFVANQFQGQGIGRQLAETLIHNARTLGYSVMRLDTGTQQTTAKNLYYSMGFRDIPPYYPVSQVMKEELVFMELML
ncbi:MAG: GNAT family N-acetyltransferase [Cyanobacteria bacterium P01_D01_bin.105]